MADRTCSLPGCDTEHRAKGLCATHYNQRMLTPEQRHPRVVKACTTCGAPVVRLPGERYATVACSPRCRTVAEFGGTSQSEYDWASCSMTRARRFGAPVVDRIERLDVFERDGWRCQVCDLSVRISGDEFTPESATVDHIVPLSLGGSHTLANVQTCCLSCNSSKGKRSAA